MKLPGINNPALFPAPKRELDINELKLLSRIQRSCAQAANYTCIFYMAASKEANVDMSRTPYIKLAGDISTPVARVIYELYNGKFNPKRRVRHACGNARCVHPDHLYLADGFNNINTKAVVANPEALYQKIFGMSQSEVKNALYDDPTVRTEIQPDTEPNGPGDIQK